MPCIPHSWIHQQSSEAACVLRYNRTDLSLARYAAVGAAECVSWFVL